MMPTVLIYWSPGRTAEQKQHIVEQITSTLVNHGSARAEDVLIIFQTIEPGDAARAGSILTPPQLQSGTPDKPAAASHIAAGSDDGCI